MSWEDYKQALEEEKRAENRSLAELHRAMCPSGRNPYVYDKRAKRWLTSDEIYNKMLKGDEK